MFLGFANFYKRFIKSFSKIAALFTSMFKIMAPSTLATLARTKANENELITNSGSNIDNSSIDDRLANLSSFIKKMSSRSGFFTFEANLTFTKLRKMLTIALIIYHFDPKRHVQIKTDASGYAIGRILSQLTTEKDLAD